MYVFANKTIKLKHRNITQYNASILTYVLRLRSRLAERDINSDTDR